MGENDGWSPVDSKKNFWTPTKENNEVIGKLTGIEDGTYGKRYTITSADEKIHILPSHAMLQALMSEVSLGEQVKVVFTGEKANTKGNPTQLYEVFRKNA